MADKDFRIEKDTTLPLILPEHEELAERIEASIKSLNLPTTIHSQVKGHEAILAMVSAGLGCAMLPEIVVKKSYLKQLSLNLAILGLEKYLLHSHLLD